MTVCGSTVCTYMLVWLGQLRAQLPACVVYKPKKTLEKGYVHSLAFRLVSII